MTRLRQPERAVLDTLVDAGVARSRSDALAWSVKLVGEHADTWLADLREAMTAVDELRAKGPKVWADQPFTVTAPVATRRRGQRRVSSGGRRTGRGRAGRRRPRSASRRRTPVGDERVTGQTPVEDGTGSPNAAASRTRSSTPLAVRVNGPKPPASSLADVDGPASTSRRGPRRRASTGARAAGRRRGRCLRRTEERPRTVREDDDRRVLRRKQRRWRRARR